jgi:hypothetical protein
MSEELENTVTSTEPQGEQAAQPVIESTEQGTEQTSEATPVIDQPKVEKTPAWVQKRIDQLTAEKYQERQGREAAEKRLSEQQFTAPEQTNAPADVETRAKQLIAQRDFDSSCNKVYEAGKSEFSDFDAALQNFSLLGGLPPSFLEATTQLPDGHRVLYQLGKDPEQASRILNLPPIPMALELAKLIAAKPAAKPVSRAPSPISPIDGTGRVETDPEKMPIKEWMQWRKAQLSKA